LKKSSARRTSNSALPATGWWLSPRSVTVPTMNTVPGNSVMRLSLRLSSTAVAPRGRVSSVPGGSACPVDRVWRCAAFRPGGRSSTSGTACTGLSCSARLSTFRPVSSAARAGAGSRAAASSTPARRQMACVGVIDRMRPPVCPLSLRGRLD